jgi:hypothetical protein
MNKTLLLVICDFLLLNLLALTRWEKAEPARAKQPPVPELSSNAATKDRDLVDTMKQSLEDERASRTQLEQKLSSAQADLGTRDKSVQQLSSEKSQLSDSLNATQHANADLNRKVAAAAQEAAISKEELARLQRELERRREEADRQAKELADAAKAQSDAQDRINSLNVAVKVSEQEKAMLRDTAENLKTQVAAERDERLKVQATTAQLAGGVGQLAESTSGLTKEIRENRPINANELFEDFLKNRVSTNFTGVRSGLLGPATRERKSSTVLVTDGTKTYALLHIADTPFPLYDNTYDWQKIAVDFSGPQGYQTSGKELDFLSLDSRIVVIPVDDDQVAALGVKVYKMALDPFKFPEAVLVHAGEKSGYGEVPFKLDPDNRSYVKVENKLLKRLFGDFGTARGDLVLSKTGELLGVMVNSDYCAVVNNFLPAKTLKTGDNVSDQKSSLVLNDLAARVRSLPLPLQ